MRLRSFLLLVSIFAGFVPTQAARAADDGLLAWWAFEEVADAGTPERAGGQRDAITGYFKLVDGVSGRALRCDGFTTCVKRAADKTPRLGEAFTTQAWVAVQAYPWGWCPIVTQRKERESGYLFAVDARGHVGLHLAIEGQWRGCTSEAIIPLMQWVHVAAAFDAASGIIVYINGEETGRLATAGTPDYARDVPLLIGRNHEKEEAMFSSEWGQPEQPVHFAFDGLIDEVKVHGRCLTPDEISEAYTSTRRDNPPEMKPRRMPSGPKDVERFGAFYEQLKYCETWDDIWRGEGPDVVVAFDFAPVRLVFWRGTSYAPCWVTEKGNWFTNEFMERGPDRKNRGCSESMSDKRAHYSHVKILENSEARAVVYWRNAPVGVNYELTFVDEITRWGDWSEEYHIVYPDGVSVRKVVMWSSNFKAWHEWCQSIQPLHPGQRPEDVLDADRILSVANMKGETKTYGWEEGKASYNCPTIEGANIQITYLDSRFNPFLVLHDREGKNDRGGNGPAILRVGGDGWSEHSPFPWRNHWPVTQVPVFGRYAQAADRPAHTWTATQASAPYETTGQSMTKIMLCGMTDRPIEALLPLARSWLRPPELVFETDAFVSEGYDQAQRAYVLACRTSGDPDHLSFRIDASTDSPMVNLALVVREWGERGVKLTLDGELIPRGERFRWGHRQRLDGADLVTWIRLEATSTVRFDLIPLPPQ